MAMGEQVWAGTRALGTQAIRRPFSPGIHPLGDSRKPRRSDGRGVAPMARMRGLTLLLVALVAAVALAGEVAAQDLAGVLPGIKDHAAPAWVKEGQRLTYYSAVASTPNSLHYYTPNKDGDWVSGDGERWDQGSQPGAAGHGFTTVDVLGVETGGALCGVQGWQKDLVSGKIARIASARSAYGCLPAGGDWWVHPKVLAKVAETLAVDTRTLDQMKVLRMGMKMIDGKTRNVLRFDFVHAQSRHVLAYELETGALVYKAAAAQGPKDRFAKGNTIIIQMWLVEQRQVKPPWAGLPIHEGFAKGWALHYDAAYTVLVPSAGSNLTLPLSIDAKVTAAGKTWFTYDQVSQMGALRGMPAPAPETARLACGTSQTDPLWIPPAALKGLRAGLVIDRDEKVNEKVSVKSADASSVVLLYEDEAGASERTYDAASGLMTAFKAAGGPGDLAKSVIQGRLTKGALGAPRAADERPASAPVATGESPDSVARAVLVAYRAKDVNALAQLAIDENRKMLDEMAEQGMKHPRYKSLFGDN